MMSSFHDDADDVVPENNLEIISNTQLTDFVIPATITERISDILFMDPITELKVFQTESISDTQHMHIVITETEWISDRHFMDVVFKKLKQRVFETTTHVHC